MTRAEELAAIEEWLSRHEPQRVAFDPNAFFEQGFRASTSGFFSSDAATRARQRSGEASRRRAIQARATRVRT